MFIQEKCIEEGMECSFKEVQLKRWEGGGSNFKECEPKRGGGVSIQDMWIKEKGWSIHLRRID